MGEDGWFVVVEQPRVFRSGDRSWHPRCPETACKLNATHEIKRGPKFVSRWCEPHALAECDRLNVELEADIDGWVWAAENP